MPVYHFLAAHWAEDDLARSRLKISRFDDLNDPFELLAPELGDRTVREAFQAVRDDMCARRVYFASAGRGAIPCFGATTLISIVESA